MTETNRIEYKRELTPELDSLFTPKSVQLPRIDDIMPY